MPTREEVINVLKEIYDPEIPVDIWNLGLIYGIEIDDGKINISMIVAIGKGTESSNTEFVKKRFSTSICFAE